MITGPDNLFVLPDVDALLREELARARAIAASLPGRRALLLQGHESARAFEADLRPFIATRVHVGAAGLEGDVACSAGALPWGDDAFELAVVQHADDVPGPSAGFVDEIARVLAPGGTLVWYGFNPLSPWHAWMRWHARGGVRMPRVASADGVRRQVLRAGFVAASIVGIGPCWPGGTRVARSRPLTHLRAAWMLVASKQRAVLTPLRPRARPVRALPQPALAPSRRVRA